MKTSLKQTFSAKGCRLLTGDASNTRSGPFGCLYRLSRLSYDCSWDAGDRRRRLAALPEAGNFRLGGRRIPAWWPVVSRLAAGGSQLDGRRFSARRQAVFDLAAGGSRLGSQYGFELGGRQFSTWRPAIFG
jgi:hypothetical protein